MDKKQERKIENNIKQILNEVNFQGLKAGAAGILGAVLEMCNSDKSDVDIVKEIKSFCEKSLRMDGVN